MRVELENVGELDTATVNQAGCVYVGKEYTGKDVKIAFEVVDDE